MMINEENEEIFGFGLETEIKSWKREWQGMPEYVQEDLMPFKQIKVNFANQEDVELFEELMKQKITPKTKFIWFPQAEIRIRRDKRYANEDD